MKNHQMVALVAILFVVAYYVSGNAFFIAMSLAFGIGSFFIKD